MRIKCKATNAMCLSSMEKMKMRLSFKKIKLEWSKITKIQNKRVWKIMEIAWIFQQMQILREKALEVEETPKEIDPAL